MKQVPLLSATSADRYTQPNHGETQAEIFRKYRQEALIESYGMWPLAVSGDENEMTWYTQGAVRHAEPPFRSTPAFDGMKAVLLVRTLPVHASVAYEVLGSLSPADAEKLSLPTVSIVWHDFVVERVDPMECKSI